MDSCWDDALDAISIKTKVRAATVTRNDYLVSRQHHKVSGCRQLKLTLKEMVAISLHNDPDTILMTTSQLSTRNKKERDSIFENQIKPLVRGWTIRRSSQKEI